MSMSDKRIKELMEKMAKDGSIAPLLQMFAMQNQNVHISQKLQDAQDHLNENPFTLEVAKEIREITKKIRAKMKNPDTNPQTILDLLFKLSPLAVNDHNMRSVADTGILDVLYLLVGHSDLLLRRASLFLLSEIAVNVENSVRMVKEGAVALALKAGLSKDTQLRIYSVKLCNNLLKAPQTNSSLSLYLLDNESFVKNLRWMNSLRKPIDVHAVYLSGFVPLPFEPCNTGMQTLGMLCSSKVATFRAEELDLIDDLLDCLNAITFKSTTAEKNVASIAMWALGRSYVSGLTTKKADARLILEQTSNGVPPIADKPSLFDEPQIDFVPVEPQALRPDDPVIPTEAIARKCSLLSCEVRESATMKLKVCGGCKVSNYCSREHQVQDWKQGHKARCAPGKN